MVIQINLKYMDNNSVILWENLVTTIHMGFSHLEILTLRIFPYVKIFMDLHISKMTYSLIFVIKMKPGMKNPIELGYLKPWVEFIFSHTLGEILV